MYTLTYRYTSIINILNQAIRAAKLFLYSLKKITTMVRSRDSDFDLDL